MTDVETKEWGAAEMTARKADLEAVRAGTMTLQEAQAQAVSRRKTAGLTRFRASCALRGGR